MRNVQEVVTYDYYWPLPDDSKAVRFRCSDAKNDSQAIKKYA